MSEKEETVKELKSTFEDFKEINERREKEIEEHGEALAETEQTLEELNEKMDELETKVERPGLEGPDKDSDGDSEYKEVFFKSLKNGEDALEPDERKELTVADDTTGGYLAPSEYVTDIIEGVTEYSPVREVANVRQTSNKSLEYPTKEGTFSARWVGETESRTETTGMEWGLEEIPTHELEALVKVSKQNLQDSAFDLEAMLQDEFTEQFGVAEGSAFIDGDAVGKPEGILTNSDVGSIDSGSNDSLGADDLIDLFYEPKSPYANNGTWLLKRGTIKEIRKLKDGNDQYLWQPGLAGEQPATILDQPYLECPDMPAVSGDSYPVAFGDFGRGYLIVDRTQMNVLRDPYSSKPLVEFEAYRRVGGQVVLPEAIKLLHVTSS